MITWIVNNIGTVIACLLVAAVICFAAAVVIRGKRKGRTSCGCNCAHCAMAGSCHKMK